MGNYKWRFIIVILKYNQHFTLCLLVQRSPGLPSRSQVPHRLPAHHLHSVLSQHQSPSHRRWQQPQHPHFKVLSHNDLLSFFFPKGFFNNRQLNWNVNMTCVLIVLPQHTNTQTWRILYSSQTGWYFRRKEGCVIQITVTCSKLSDMSNHLICMLVLRPLFQRRFIENCP